MGGRCWRWAQCLCPVRGDTTTNHIHDDAIVVAHGMIGGHKAVVAAMAFEFMDATAGMGFGIYLSPWDRRSVAIVTINSFTRLACSALSARLDISFGSVSRSNSCFTFTSG